MLFNEMMLCPEGVSPDVYDKLYCFKQTNKWTTLNIGKVKLRPGENYIRFYNGDGEIKVDAIILEQI